MTEPPQPPPPPNRLPAMRPRVRRLNWLPLVLGVLLISGAIGAMLWALAGAPDNAARTQQAAMPPSDGGRASDEVAVLSKAPHGPYIPASTGAPAQIAPPRFQPPAIPPPQVQYAPPRPPEPGMTAVEIEARKQAWQAYFEEQRHVRQMREDALSAALAADTMKTDAGTNGESTTQAGNGGPGAPPGAGESKGKKDFFGQAGASPDTDYLPAMPTDPISRYELKAADVIEGKMLSGLTTESHGIVKAIVTRNVFDHATGTHILIPQGATLVGIYDTATSTGQQRVEVGWERVIYPPPCDQSLDLGLMPGSDQSGFSGFHDITETHFWEIARNLALASVFSAGIQLSQPQNSNPYGGYSSQQVVAGALGQQLGEFGMEFARRGMDIPPTEKVRQGYPFTIMVTKDIAFARPWQDGVCGGAMEAAIGP